MEVKQTKAVKPTKAVKQVKQTKRFGLRKPSLWKRKLQGRETQRRDIQRRSQLLLLPCLAIAVTLVAAACGGSGAPTGFGDDEGGDTVKQNFIEGCDRAVKDSELSVPATRVCQCTYDNIVRESQTSEGITFAKFDEVDDDLREDINKLSEPTNDRVISKIREYMRDCITANS